MTSINNIMVYATKSERIVKASQYLATLFPNAVYHVVAVAPTLSSRCFYTSLYREVMRKIAEEAVSEVELVLLSKHVLSVKKVILRGKPSRELLRYAKDKSIDLIAVASSIDSKSPITPVIGNIIMRAEVPIFFYAPLAKDPPVGIDSILVAGEEKLDKAINFAISLAQQHDAQITLYHGIEREEELDKIKDILSSSNVKFIMVKSKATNIEDKVKEILNLAEKSDILVFGLKVSIRKSRRKPFRATVRLDTLEYTLLELSPIPIILFK